ncbi:MAG: PQQ-binding-like beta-propeller repeat protein [Acidobacteriota bacterium]
MNPSAKEPRTPGHPLRLWPGIVLVVTQWLARFGLPLIVPAAVPIGAMAALLCGLGIVVWWMFFSRAPRAERFGAVALLVVLMVSAWFLLHPSIATGMMGLMFIVYSVPVISLAFVVWTVASRGLSVRARWASMAGAIALGCGVWTLVQTAGMTGNAESEFMWRWADTPEERLLARGEVAATGSVAEADLGSTWPGFRGVDRNGDVPGERIATDWAASPPMELWRRPVGPGWSSFAVANGVFYTQEQRGEEEVVSAYELTTGEPVWRHRDPVRFWESNAGPGPRGTPTLHQGRIFSFGATGVLNALRAEDGSRLWSRDVAADTGVNPPTWGFASSPLVAGDLVVVAASGALAAYDLDSGEPRWLGPNLKGGYSSPHLLTLGGVEQILQLRGKGLVSVAVADGKLLWEHDWSGDPVLQPALTDQGDVLISVNAGSGIRRIAVDQGSEGWATEELWTSRGLKPYFSDFVVHRGHAYGFDGRILSCIELESGERQWKGGRYGSGQLVLLPRQDLLLVISEQGELALVQAKPDGFAEVARFPALASKTWNHPVLVGDHLLVRNDREMAAFRLAMADGL